MAVRWGNKLGRRCLALLNIKMYYACSLAKRKRDAPTYEDSFSSIVVDENNAVKASSKLLKLFIFFWDLNLDAATEERMDKSTAFTEAEENNFRYSFIDVAPASTVQHAMEVPVCVCRSSENRKRTKCQMYIFNMVVLSVNLTSERDF